MSHAGAVGASIGQTEIELLLERIDRLPTLSPVATRLVSLSSVDEMEMNEVAGLLESDPALTTMILGLCRRAMRDLPTPPTTVRRAVVMLGLEAVRLAALSVSVYELIREEGSDGGSREGAGAPRGRLIGAGIPEDGIDRRGLWKHAVSVACCAELLAERQRSLGIKPEEAFVAGLLHDIGRLVLDLVAPRALAQVERMAEERGRDSGPLERELLGIDHQTAGRRAAERWGLPEATRDVIWRHSQPWSSLPEGEHRRLIGLVSLSKAFCRRSHLGWCGDFGEPADPAKLAVQLGLEPSACDGLLPELVPEVRERCSVLGLDEQTDVDLLSQSIAEANRRLAVMGARLRERAEAGRLSGRVLEAVGRFASGREPPRRLVDAVEEVAASASGLFGEGWLGALARPEGGEPWRAYRFGPSGAVDKAWIVPSPADADPSVLSGIARGLGRPVGSLGPTPWLAVMVGELNPPADARVLPVVVCAPDDAGGSRGPSVLLVHEAKDRDFDGDARPLGALLRVWAGHVRTAAAAERSDRVSERLADTARHLAETQELLAERDGLARLGEMTAGAAHELNTPLAVAEGRARLLLERLEAGTAAHSEARTVAEAASEAASIVRELHELALPRTPSPGPVTVGELVRRAASMAEGEGSGPVRLASDGLLVVMADEALAARALAAVLRNAFEAAPGEAVAVTAGPDGMGRSAVLRIVDRGDGFSERALRHGFDPFFSERRAGRGRGLGLPLARRLLEMGDGTIALGRDPAGEGGGCVTVTLPLGEASGQQDRPARLAG